MGKRAAQKIPRGLLKQYKVNEMAAPMVLMLMYDDDILLFPEEKNPDWKVQSRERALAEEIQNCSDPARLVKYMRKPMSGPCRAVLLRRALAFEDATLPLAEDLALRSIQDEFIDSFTALLLYTHKNPSPWILENYANIRSDFLKSQLCVILGVRGTPKYIDFLVGELKNLEGRSQEDPLEQGPLVALNLLKEWPDDDTDWEPKDNYENVYNNFSFDMDDIDEDMSEDQVREKMKEDPAFAKKVQEAVVKETLNKQKQMKEWEKQGMSLERIAFTAGLPEDVTREILNMSADQ